MSTTDSTALQERIARALARQAGYDPDDHCDEWVMDGMRESAAAVLPIVEAEVRDAKAEAWHHGFQEGYCLEPRPDWANALSNPYRETGGQT